MDIEKLIDRLRNNNIENNCHDCALGYYAFETSNALSTLQAENAQLRAELGQVKRERDALIEDFADYVTGGVPNPAIFCKNRCNKCVDMREWCTGKNCKGFYPSGASGQKED